MLRVAYIIKKVNVSNEKEVQTHNNYVSDSPH